MVLYRLDWSNFAAVDGDAIRAGDAIDGFFLDARTSLTGSWPADHRLVDHEPDATAVENDSLTWQGRRDFGPGEPRVDVRRGGASGETPGAGGLPLLPLGVVVVLLVAGAGWLVYRRLPDERGDGAPTGAAAGDGSADEPPPELLSNEERVRRLLERQGGRIKQQRVAAELEWTDATTSQVVSDLREAGELESVRLGRENVLTLPDVSIQSEGHDEESGT